MSNSPENTQSNRGRQLAAAAAVIITAVSLGANKVDFDTAPSEVTTFSDPNNVAEFKDHGFPVTIRKEYVQPGDHTPTDVLNRLNIEDGAKADVLQEIEGQVGGAGHMNADEEIFIPAENYNK